VRLFKLGSLVPRSRLEVISGGTRLAVWELDELRSRFMTGCRKIFGIEERREA